MDDVSISSDCPHLHVTPGADVKDDDDRSRSDSHWAVAQLPEITAPVDHLDLQRQSGVSVEDIAALLGHREVLAVEGGHPGIRDTGLGRIAGQDADLSDRRHVIPPLFGAGERGGPDVKRQQLFPVNQEILLHLDGDQMGLVPIVSADFYLTSRQPDLVVK